MAADCKTKVQHDSCLSVNHNISACTADAVGGARGHARSDARRIMSTFGKRLVWYISTTLWSEFRTTQDLPTLGNQWVRKYKNWPR